jgi:hypothetical protein
MFRLGGSTGQGITSGLRRQGYAIGDRVTTEDILKSYGPAPRGGYGVYDFLTDWGLRMASATPSGNVLQTGAKQAIEPFAQLTKGKGEAQLRDWATKVQATDKALDINLKKELAEYAALKQQNQYKKYGVLEPRISYTQDQVKLNMDSSNLTSRYFPENMAVYQAAEVYDKTNHPNIMLAPMVETKDKKSQEVNIINGFNELEKGGVDVASKIFFDPSSGEWFNVVKVGPEWKVDKSEKPIISLEAEEDFGDSSLFKMQTYIKEKEELESDESGLTDIKFESEEAEELYKDKQKIQMEAASLGLDYDLVPPRDNKQYEGKNWVGWYKRNVNPKAVTLDELRLLISKTRHKLLVERKQTSNTSRLNIKSSDSNVASTQ